MIDKFNLLKLGARIEQSQLSTTVFVRDGIASTSDGNTSVIAPIELADCAFQIKPVLSALNTLKDAKLEVQSKALIIKNNGESSARVRVPLLEIEKPLAHENASEWQEINIEVIDALAHVSRFASNDFSRPQLQCLRIENGNAYASTGYSAARYPIGDKDLDLIIDAKTIAPILKIEPDKIEKNDSSLRVTKGDCTIICNLSSLKFPMVSSVFSSFSKSDLVDIEPKTRESFASARAFMDTINTIVFHGDKMATSKNIELAEYVVDMQDNIGEGAFSHVEIAKIMSIAEKGFFKYGEPCFFTSGDLDMMTIGLRK